MYLINTSQSKNVDEDRDLLLNRVPIVHLKNVGTLYLPT